MKELNLKSLLPRLKILTTVPDFHFPFWYISSLSLEFHFEHLRFYNIRFRERAIRVAGSWTDGVTVERNGRPQLVEAVVVMRFVNERSHGWEKQPAAVGGSDLHHEILERTESRLVEAAAVVRFVNRRCCEGLKP